MATKAASAKGNPGGALCHCGRPLGHTGRHIGSSPARRDPAAAPKDKRPKIAVAVEAQIKHCHDNIARLKREMNDRAAQLRRAESELAPLKALHEVYRDLALPAPDAPAEEPPTPVVAPSPPPPASQAGNTPALFRQTARVNATERPEATDEDFTPIEAELPSVTAWAAQRGLTCKSWDDLPAVNRKREQLGLPTFKRKLMTRSR